MTDSATIETISDQFRRALGMFREATLAFPADQWRKGEVDYLRPAGVAYHVVECIDFYTGSQPANQFSWGGRFGVDWEDSQSARLPSQEQVITYLDEIEGRLEDWLRETGLLSPEQTFPWTGASVLGRALYMLRHTQHHVGEMNIELTRRGYSGPGWQ